MEQKTETIDEYIALFPIEVQNLLRNVRQTIHEAAPEATEAISYGMPTFKMNGKNLIHFAAFTKHIGIYPLPHVIETFKEDLSPYVQGKGSVQFPLDKPIPYDLIKRMTLARLKETGKNNY